MRYRFGEFELRPDQSELLRDDRPVALQPQPMKVLTVLVSRAGRLVRRPELFAEIWAEETHVDFDRGLNFCIKQIRTALDDDASEPRFVRTVPKQGYRFIAEVEPVEDVATPARAWRWKGAVAVAILALGLGARAQFLSGSGAGESVDARALSEYTRGRFLADTGSSEDAAESLGHFERAIAIEPEFAEAHLALARMAVRVPGDPTKAAARSRRAVLRALELDPDLAEAHAHLAALALYADWDWRDAEKSYRRALEIQPSVAELHHGYASFLALMGRHDEAIVEIQRAMVLDPVSTALRADAGWFYYQARRFDEAVEICGAAAALEPDNENALWCLLQAHRHAGRHAEATRAARRLGGRLSGSPKPFDRLEAFWRWYLSWLDEHPQASTPTSVGLVHLALGDSERALGIFERAYESGASCVLTIGSDPQLEPLRGHPRFERLLAKLRLPSR